jgi:hypothetical protein
LRVLFFFLDPFPCASGKVAPCSCVCIVCEKLRLTSTVSLTALCVEETPTEAAVERENNNGQTKDHTDDLIRGLRLVWVSMQVSRSL